jgi:ATP-dependent DNA helicase RecQ
MFKQDLFILTSPPASGKTYWIHSFAKEVFPKKILVISPLRALADECREKWGDEISVMTPEEWLGKRFYSEIVIIDEFHLFFYWGDTFRPIMWEVFFELTSKAQFVCLLTATLSSDIENAVKNFSCHFDSLNWIDCGNLQLKYSPTHYIKAPSRAWIQNQIELEPKGNDVRLIFCEYRNEVLAMEKYLVSLGFSCVSCIGGEARYMKDKLAKLPRPDFIVATTVLSHGVNLPEIQKIFFLYPVKNRDFWIQMVARGGRRGGAYTVYALEKPFGIEWSFTKNFLRVFWETILQKLSIKSISF